MEEKQDHDQGPGGRPEAPAGPARGEGEEGGDEREERQKVTRLGVACPSMRRLRCESRPINRSSPRVIER